MREPPPWSERTGDVLAGWSDEADAAARERAARRRTRHERRRDARPEPARPAPAAGAQPDRLSATRWGRVLLGSVAAIALATAIGLVLLWPTAHSPHGRSQAMGGATLAATVAGARDLRCPGPTAQRCRQLTVRLDQGIARGRRTTIDIGPSASVSRYVAGDRVRVQPAAAAPGAKAAPAYELAGLDRRGTLRWLLIAFAALVVVLARWRGALALLGFAASVLVLLKFLVPAMLAGSSPVLVALVGSLAVMFITVGLTYGFSPQSAAAILGISASLLAAALMGELAVHGARLDGRSSDLSIYLQQGGVHVSLQGIVLAGLVLGALGVLADMAVTQASAVIALRRANPALGMRALFGGAFGVGRDHLIATTHTLALVYVGATLPLLLVLRSTGVDVTDALNSQDVAEPIVATVVGALALLLSVPLTTALAAALVLHVPVDALPAGEHGHHHH